MKAQGIALGADSETFWFIRRGGPRVRANLPFGWRVQIESPRWGYREVAASETPGGAWGCHRTAPLGRCHELSSAQPMSVRCQLGELSDFAWLVTASMELTASYANPSRKRSNAMSIFSGVS
ncbi:hypothetical protein CA85_39610 [Allorhodopirellula solitaria]|uniref:Uncharacterized protein n=1 Tax=Allorhodopirellula solitaria TaxID=2527987 RepID=A0A5C5XAQ4_9BACT|nr:hypothetical protein CA85_39610 [Allorhodopirellula solitaria]